VSDYPKETTVYRTILLTHDGSELAALAVSHAATVAKGANARIVVVQAIDSVGQMMSRMTPMIEPVPVGDITVELAEEMVAAQREAAEQNLVSVKNALAGEGITDVTTKVVEGPAGDAILDTANAEHADLIVMATHGRGGLGRAILGSVADHVVRSAKHQAVLLVRPPAD
jgi:nucleotide-binding universal stress UspA family protein